MFVHDHTQGSLYAYWSNRSTLEFIIINIVKLMFAQFSLH